MFIVIAALAIAVGLASFAIPWRWWPASLTGLIKKPPAVAYTATPPTASKVPAAHGDDDALNHLRAAPRHGRKASAPLPTAEALRQQLVSVNWHFTRVCNYKCDFCYHVNTNSFVHSIEKGKEAIRLLRDAGTKKLNFSGGEPFMYPKQLAAWCREARCCGMYVSIITNGNRVTEEWMRENHKHVDMIGVSVDSAHDDTHEGLGRWDPSNPGHIAGARRVASWCREFDVAFKINTVITKLNVMDDMTTLIQQLQPKRWKIFQMLLIKGENIESEHRDASDLSVADVEFRNFVDRHVGIASIMKVEDNDTMRNSYVILNERLQFLDNSDDTKVPSTHSILEVGVAQAFASTFFDAANFRRRDGDFFIPGNGSTATAATESRSIANRVPDLEDL